MADARSRGAFRPGRRAGGQPGPWIL